MLEQNCTQSLCVSVDLQFDSYLCTDYWHSQFLIGTNQSIPNRLNQSIPNWLDQWKVVCGDTLRKRALFATILLNFSLLPLIFSKYYCYFESKLWSFKNSEPWCTKGIRFSQRALEQLYTVIYNFHSYISFMAPHIGYITSHPMKWMWLLLPPSENTCRRNGCI